MTDGQNLLMGKSMAIITPVNIAIAICQEDKPWEECRGMGFSFSYNQNEDIEDYSSPQGLILTLVNIVSKGGNLLLGIGPNGNGKIPLSCRNAYCKWENG